MTREGSGVSQTHALGAHAKTAPSASIPWNRRSSSPPISLRVGEKGCGGWQGGAADEAAAAAVEHVDDAFGVAGIAREEGVEVGVVIARGRCEARADGAEDDIGLACGLNAQEFGQPV